MTQKLSDFEEYIKLHDGYNKPRLNFQDMYRRFPTYEFVALPDFGKYSNFGKAYENKDLSMRVKTPEGFCTLVYREYYDVTENTAYITRD